MRETKKLEQTSKSTSNLSQNDSAQTSTKQLKKKKLRALSSDLHLHQS